MSAQNNAALIIPSNDPHFSEYVADRWKTRAWISGFTGSAGTVVVTDNAAALWTDSRYFLQAEEQLKDSGITLKKLKVEGTESIEDWLKQQLPARSRVAIDKNLYSIAEFDLLKKTLAPLYLAPIDDFFDEIWSDRPGLPFEKAFILDKEYAGESIGSKLSRLRETLGKHSSSYIYPITLLDEIAWLYNLRGADISYNPLTLAYALVTPEYAYLFINQDKLTFEDKKELEAEGVTICSYSDLGKTVKCHNKERFCIFNPKKTAVGTFEILEEAGFDLAEDCNPNGIITSLKSIKNDTEQQGFRKAMLDDGVALVRFQRWLEQEVASGAVTELSAANQLLELRSQSESFVGNSFGSIMGYKEHGAIGHYHATSDTNAVLRQENFLLLDSGAQYLDGTTDITRTIALGPVTKQQKKDYTLVLKGNIALSVIHFPLGTCGFQLDVLARQFLWNNHINYGHGTGHGIGHFLCVHEGPQSIRVDNNNTTLEEGMVLSNEPGVYRPGEYGVRLENMQVVIKSGKTGFGEFLQFETLTLFPYDKKSIDFSLLNREELEWLNNYHNMVYERLSPFLNAEEQKWLQQKTENQLII